MGVKGASTSVIHDFKACVNELKSRNEGKKIQIETTRVDYASSGFSKAVTAVQNASSAFNGAR
jgi:hypothetical protein